MTQLSVSTHDRTEFLDITDQVQKALDDLDINNGSVTVFIPHTTAGITINENADPDLIIDLRASLEGLVPLHAGYKHDEGDSAAHVKASLMGSSVHVPVESGSLQLGTWQAIYFCEFDGPRTRKVWVS